MNFIERLIQEQDEVEGRLIKLSKFIDNEKFNELDQKQQRLLFMQQDAMSLYLAIIKERLFLINKIN